LRPAAAADRRTWLRRVTFDLTGLPPTSEEIDAFLADGAPGAEAEVVDRLLASPRFGERWARHWLDPGRYADLPGPHFSPVPPPPARRPAPLLRPAALHGRRPHPPLRPRTPARPRPRPPPPPPGGGVQRTGPGPRLLAPGRGGAFPGGHPPGPGRPLRQPPRR